MVVTSTVGCCSTFSVAPRLPPRRPPPALAVRLVLGPSAGIRREPRPRPAGRVRRHVRAIWNPEQEHDDAQHAVEDRPATHQSLPRRRAAWLRFGRGAPAGASPPGSSCVVVARRARVVVVTPCPEPRPVRRSWSSTHPSSARWSTSRDPARLPARRWCRAELRRRGGPSARGRRGRRTPEGAGRRSGRRPRRPPAASWSCVEPSAPSRRLRRSPRAGAPPPPSLPRRARSRSPRRVAESVRGPFAPATAPRRLTSTNGIASCWSYSSPDTSSANGLSSPDSVSRTAPCGTDRRPPPSSPACSGR